MYYGFDQDKYYTIINGRNLSSIPIQELFKNDTEFRCCRDIISNEIYIFKKDRIFYNKYGRHQIIVGVNGNDRTTLTGFMIEHLERKIPVNLGMLVEIPGHNMPGVLIDIDMNDSCKIHFDGEITATTFSTIFIRHFCYVGSKKILDYETAENFVIGRCMFYYYCLNTTWDYTNFMVKDNNNKIVRFENDAHRFSLFHSLYKKEEIPKKIEKEIYYNDVTILWSTTKHKSYALKYFLNFSNSKLNISLILIDLDNFDTYTVDEEECKLDNINNVPEFKSFIKNSIIYNNSSSDKKYIGFYKHTIVLTK